MQYIDLGTVKISPRFRNKWSIDSFLYICPLLRDGVTSEDVEEDRALIGDDGVLRLVVEIKNRDHFEMEIPGGEWSIER
jgi:hypothetical protein